MKSINIHITLFIMLVCSVLLVACGNKEYDNIEWDYPESATEDPSGSEEQSDDLIFGERYLTRLSKTPTSVLEHAATKKLELPSVEQQNNKIYISDLEPKVLYKSNNNRLCVCNSLSNNYLLYAKSPGDDDYIVKLLAEAKISDGQTGSANSLENVVFRSLASAGTGDTYLLYEPIERSKAVDLIDPNNLVKVSELTDDTYSISGKDFIYNDTDNDVVISALSEETRYSVNTELQSGALAELPSIAFVDMIQLKSKDDILNEVSQNDFYFKGRTITGSEEIWFEDIETDSNLKKIEIPVKVANPEISLSDLKPNILYRYKVTKDSEMWSQAIIHNNTGQGCLLYTRGSSDDYYDIEPLMSAKLNDYLTDTRIPAENTPTYTALGIQEDTDYYYVLYEPIDNDTLLDLVIGDTVDASDLNDINYQMIQKYVYNDIDHDIIVCAGESAIGESADTIMKPGDLMELPSNLDADTFFVK